MSIRTLTQEDPIGLAGGLNLYGFAGGDPINFSDPFGLCKQGTEGCLPMPDLNAQMQSAMAGDFSLSEANEQRIQTLAPDLQRSTRALVNRTYFATGKSFHVHSGTRSFAEQDQLHQSNPNGAAPPGLSWHNYGRAFDAYFHSNGAVGGSYRDYSVAGGIAEELGWVWGGRWGDDLGHFDSPNADIVQLYMNNHLSGIPPGGRD